MFVVRVAGRLARQFIRFHGNAGGAGVVFEQLVHQPGEGVLRRQFRQS